MSVSIELQPHRLRADTGSLAGTGTAKGSGRCLLNKRGGFGNGTRWRHASSETDVRLDEQRGDQAANVCMGRARQNRGANWLWAVVLLRVAVGCREGVQLGNEWQR